jgi:3-deoxy-manno-octulosonate cytidylyltransferase (CMP-KDO synthetase)
MERSPFKIVIPARYASTRLPGKPLRNIAGRPMLQHVYERAQSSGANEVIVATDDDRIEAAAAAFGARVCMTSPEHTSGTDRLAEVVQACNWNSSTIVVNLQGDEPMMPPGLIDQVAGDLAERPGTEVATLAHPVDNTADMSNPDLVKVVLDCAGNALYFSRASIPWQRDPGEESAPGLRHIGLYAYRAGFLQHYSQLKPAPLECIEKLEQLRILWHGIKIHVGIAAEMPGQGVDTEADLEIIARLMN